MKNENKSGKWFKITTTAGIVIIIFLQLWSVGANSVAYSNIEQSYKILATNINDNTKTIAGDQDKLVEKINELIGATNAKR